MRISRDSHLQAFGKVETRNRLNLIIMAPLSDVPASYVVEPVTAHDHTVIALHGRGSHGLEFAEELFEVKSSSDMTFAEQFPTCRWVFPSPQERDSTVF